LARNDLRELDELDPDEARFLPEDPLGVVRLPTRPDAARSAFRLKIDWAPFLAAAEVNPLETVLFEAVEIAFPLFLVAALILPVVPFLAFRT